MRHSYAHANQGRLDSSETLISKLLGIKRESEGKEMVGKGQNQGQGFSSSYHGRGKVSILKGNEERNIAAEEKMEADGGYDSMDVFSFWRGIKVIVEVVQSGLPLIDSDPRPQRRGPKRVGKFVWRLPWGWVWSLASSENCGLRWTSGRDKDGRQLAFANLHGFGILTHAVLRLT